MSILDWIDKKKRQVQDVSGQSHEVISGDFTLFKGEQAKKINYTNRYFHNASEVSSIWKEIRKKPPIKSSTNCCV